MSAIHVRFARPGDADAFAELGAPRSHRTQKLHDGELEVECRMGEEEEVMREVEHALDDWLEDRQLPFTPEEIDGHTILVRPPAE
jgi:hypothetical protein